ncbi:hypothetical protein [Marinomonas shanghaiensis]|jgi:hypothetical protein|uniref:hypothetical protein n=1 Tax=Marinomonas shanghaiensis TaxID=2202418 RepID=UPI000DB9556F|nr:hypothetical protein [Marinomonas shanghaiensis]
MAFLERKREERRKAHRPPSSAISFLKEPDRVLLIKQQLATMPISKLIDIDQFVFRAQNNTETLR